MTLRKSVQPHMAQESVNTTRLLVLHDGHEIGPLQFREVMDRLRTGVVALDDLCRLEGAEDRAPLRLVLPKIGPPLPTPGARPSSRSDASENLRPPERIIPSTERPVDTGNGRGATQDVAPVAADKGSSDFLHPKVVIKAAPSPEPFSTAPQKTADPYRQVFGSPEPSSPGPPKNKRGIWGWSVASGLFILLVLVIILQRPSPKPQQANAPSSPAPEITMAPTVPSSPSVRPDQRDYALSKFIQAKQAFQQHNLAMARELIDQAETANPNQPAILNLRGEILTEQKEYELAEAAFRKAIEIDPNFYDAKNNLANLLSKKQAAERPDRGLQPSQDTPEAIPTVTPQITPAESPSVVNRLPGEQFPQTRSWVMTSWEVESWTPEQLRYAINEMYARDGADFLDKRIKAQFSAFEWYHPHPGQTYDQTEELFSPIEAYNLKLLGYYRDARKAGPSPGSPSGGSSPPSNSAQQQTARKPKLIYAPRPPYPPALDKMHVTGSGRFKITFDVRGNAKSVEVVQSTGNHTLDGNTIKTLKLWRAAPGSPFYILVPIDYRQKQQSRPKARANTSQRLDYAPSSPQMYVPHDMPNNTFIDPHIPR